MSTETDAATTTTDDPRTAPLLRAGMSLAEVEAALRSIDAGESGIIAFRALLILAKRDPTCGECGARIGNVELHTKHHAGGEQVDVRQLVMEFLDGIDPGELQTAVLAVLEEHDVSPIAATLDVIKATAASA